MTTDTNETIADIIAEMRKIKYNGEECAVKWCLTEWADRFDAAHKREVDKLNSAIQATVSHSDAEIDRLRREIAEPKRAGSAAKLREVCEKMLDLLTAEGFEDGGMSIELDEKQVIMWRNRFRAALAEPPRNCDRFSSYTEARAEWWKTEVLPRVEGVVSGAEPPFEEWLFAPATEKEGGL